MSKLIRVSKETVELLKQRQERMNSDYFKLTGKSRRIPLIKVVEVSIKTPRNIWLDSGELKKLFSKRVFKV